MNIYTINDRIHNILELVPAITNIHHQGDRFKVYANGIYPFYIPGYIVTSNINPNELKEILLNKINRAERKDCWNNKRDANVNFNCLYGDTDDSNT